MSELFTDIKVTKLNLDNSKMKGRGEVTVAGTLKVRFTIVEGSNGLFVSLPREKGSKPGEDGKDQYFPQVSFLSRDTQDELNKQVLAAFEGGGDSAKKAPATQYKAKGKSVPF